MIWNVSPEVFTTGPLVIRWYGVFFALSFLLGFQIEKKIFEFEGISQKCLDQLLIYMVVGTMVGARLGHCLLYEPEVYLADPLRIFKIWEGGLASHGGVMGNIIALYFFTKKYKVPSYLWLLDRITIPGALAANLLEIDTKELFNFKVK